MGTVTLAARLLLASIFAISAITKLPSPAASRATFVEFGAGEPLARAGAILLAPAELAAAAAMVLVPTARWGAAGAALLLVVFIAGMARALSEGRRPDCGCFGSLRPAPIGRSTLIRNGMLLATALYVVATAPGPAVDRWITTQGAGTVAVTLLLVLTAVAVIVYGSPGLGSSAHDPVAIPALDVGQQAPPFSLLDADGEPRTLDALCAEGLPLVLIFGSTTCGSCLGLFPQLGRWQVTLAESLRIVLILHAEADTLPAIAEQYGLAEVLADGDDAVFGAYGIQGSPAGVALTAEGRVDVLPVLGSDAIEDLLRSILRRNAPIPTPWLQTNTAA